MQITGINLINTYNKRVLPFRGDTLNSEKSLQQVPQKIADNATTKKKSDNASKFLIGSLSGGAALVALALAAKHGLLGKTVKGWVAGAENIVENAGAKSDIKSDIKIDIKVGEDILPKKPEPVAALPDSTEGSLTKPIVEKIPLYENRQAKIPKLPEPPLPKKTLEEEFKDFKTDGQIAAFFTDYHRLFEGVNVDKQVQRYDDYLKFIKENVSPEVARKHIIFSIGRFAGDNNVKIAEKTIEFAKQNPQFEKSVLDNLLSYECHPNFNSELAKHWFGRPDHLASQIDTHMDNLIKIRTMLLNSGLKCDDFSRLKARKDWLNIDYHTPNTFLIGFQYNTRMPEFKQAAFKYDMMNGIDKETADKMIKMVSAEPKATEKTLDMKIAEVIETIKQSIVK